MIISVQGGGLGGMNKEEEKPSTRYERLISDCFWTPLSIFPLKAQLIKNTGLNLKLIFSRAVND